MHRILLPAFALGVGVACTDIESESLLTSGMSAVIGVTAPGDGTARTDVILRAGGITSNTFVELTADDALTCAAGDAEAVALAEYEIGNVHGYEADFATDDPATVFTVSLVRTLDDGAPTSTAQLPAPFSVDALPASASRAADLVITWSPPATEPMTLDFTGDCVQYQAVTLEQESGSYTLVADTLLPVAGMEANNCEVDVTFRRVKDGSLDPAFGEGGLIVGTQHREASFTSTP